LVEKAGLGECPQEKGIPRRIELRRDTIQDNLSVAPKTIIL
jgi:hypothetical protein